MDNNNVLPLAFVLDIIAYSPLLVFVERSYSAKTRAIIKRFINVILFRFTKWNNVLLKFSRKFLQSFITDNDKCIVMLMLSSQNPLGILIVFCMFLIWTGLSVMAYDIEYYNSTTNWLNKSDIKISDVRQAVTLLKKVMGNIR